MDPPSSLLLLLVINGFPAVGSGVEAHHRRLIAAGLLAALRAADHLGLTAADPEDEALLLYRPGPPPAPAQVLAQARHLFEAFHGWIANFQRNKPCGCLSCRRAAGLNLRIAAHAAPLATGHGPYGEAVWLLHDLLLADARAPEYVLLTDPLLGAEREAASAWAGAWRGTFSGGPWDEIGYVSVALRDADELLPRPPHRPPGSPFFIPDWTLVLPGMPDRLALN